MSARPVDRPVVVWLLTLWALVAAMLVVGGITRLTGSGLSMVDWRPLMGALPPMTHGEWLDVFARYQASPQYEQVNSWMTLQDFQRIFAWEYVHRLLGRGLGLVFALPFLGFLVTGKLAGAWGRVGIAFLLGAGQGLMGWYMVRSGLVDIPEVSHFRLAAHLGLAFLAGSWLLWTALSLAMPEPSHGDPRLFRFGWLGLGLVAIQVVWGAFMAGKRAGLVSDTWPRMHGRWVPEAVAQATDLLPALASDPAGIHFAHRTFAWVVVAVGVAWGVALVRRGGAPRRPGAVVLVVLGAQFVLGVATVVLHVPIGVAVIHQLGGYLLVSAWLIALHALR